MSKDKLNLAGALSQRRALPPIQRGKGVQISTDEQESKTAISPNSDLARQQIDDPANQLSSDLAIMQDSNTADQQHSEPAKQQIDDLAIEQSSALAKSLESEIAVVQSSELAIQQESKTAILPNSEVKRVNRGVTLPDDLFQEYKLYGVMLRVSMHRLMEEALTAYLPELRSRVNDNH